MRKELEKVFQIPERLRVLKLSEKEGKTIVYCKVKRQKVECKHCGGETRDYDSRVTNKRHTVVGGKTIWLKITRRRIQCKKCYKVFVEPIEGITSSHFTKHFVQQLQEKARGQDFSTVGRETGVSCATVARKVWELPVPTIKEIKKRKFG